MVRRPPISTLTDTRFPYTPLFLNVPIGKITSDIRQMASEISRSGQFSANLDAESLGAAVRRSRKSHGLTQSQLAGLAGTCLPFVSEDRQSVGWGKRVSVRVERGGGACC